MSRATNDGREVLSKGVVLCRERYNGLSRYALEIEWLYIVSEIIVSLVLLNLLCHVSLGEACLILVHFAFNPEIRNCVRTLVNEKPMWS